LRFSIWQIYNPAILKQLILQSVPSLQAGFVDIPDLHSVAHLLEHATEIFCRQPHRVVTIHAPCERRTSHLSLFPPLFIAPLCQMIVYAVVFYCTQNAVQLADIRKTLLVAGTRAFNDARYIPAIN
jgi:hypothetical protein